MNSIKRLWHLANSAHCFCGTEGDICHSHERKYLPEHSSDACAQCDHSAFCHQDAPVVQQATTNTIRTWTWWVVGLVLITSLYFGAQLI